MAGGGLEAESEAWIQDTAVSGGGAEIVLHLCAASVGLRAGDVPVGQCAAGGALRDQGSAERCKVGPQAVRG